MLNLKINFVFDIAGEEAKVESDKLQPGDVMMLENLRFDSREESNDERLFQKVFPVLVIFT